MQYRKLHTLDPADLKRLDTGYSSDYVYLASKAEDAHAVTLRLKLTRLDQPYRKPPFFDEAMLSTYSRYVQTGFSYGAYDGDRLVGIALGERQAWNRTLWIWEFHVDQAYRRQGIGRALMDVMAELAKANGLRCIGLEVQNTNVPAISFYRSAGLEVDAIDLSYYTNTDATDGEVAIFMKRKL